MNASNLANPVDPVSPMSLDALAHQFAELSYRLDGPLPGATVEAVAELTAKVEALRVALYNLIAHENWNIEAIILPDDTILLVEADGPPEKWNLRIIMGGGVFRAEKGWK